MMYTDDQQQFNALIIESERWNHNAIESFPECSNALCSVSLFFFCSSLNLERAIAHLFVFLFDSEHIMYYYYVYHYKLEYNH